MRVLGHGSTSARVDRLLALILDRQNSDALLDVLNRDFERAHYARLAADAMSRTLLDGARAQPNR